MCPRELRYADFPADDGSVSERKLGVAYPPPLLLAITDAASAQNRTFYDASGRVTGRSSSIGGSTIFYDRTGRMSGRASTSGRGTTFYDRTGRTTKTGRPQTVAEGDEDHGGIPVTPAIGLGGIDQPIDLGAGQVLPRPIDRVRFSSRHSDCSFYSGWGHQFQRRFSHGFQCPAMPTVHISHVL